MFEFFGRKSTKGGKEARTSYSDLEEAQKQLKDKFAALEADRRRHKTGTQFDLLHVEQLREIERVKVDIEIAKKAGRTAEVETVTKKLIALEEKLEAERNALRDSLNTNTNA